MILPGVSEANRCSVLAEAPLKLLYDKDDLPHAKALRDERFKWLIQLGAVDLSKAPLNDEGFLFSYEHGEDHYQKLVIDRPHVYDRPEFRQDLVCLDTVLQRLNESGVEIVTPKTWAIGVDDDLPDDLEFPLFVRTPKSSWKRGGTQSRANNRKQLVDEMDLLRRAFGWDTKILARRWINVAVAGEFMFGEAPQEVRVWIVNQRPVAWSFHYLHVVPSPTGFPPSAKDLTILAERSERIGSAFQSRLIVADFVCDQRGDWWFLEAGPGAAAGTAHEAVFKFVADMLRSGNGTMTDDSVGGRL
ncbi:MAG: ATP-grasp domain-containing protein [Planctomycetota bacterium]